MFSTFDAETCEYIAKESNMNIAVVENDHQLQKFLQVWKLRYLPLKFLHWLIVHKFYEVHVHEHVV